MKKMIAFQQKSIKKLLKIIQITLLTSYILFLKTMMQIYFQMGW